jgi:hypothetical protein
MNLQTVKPRARWLVGGNPLVDLMWEVRHPLTGVCIWSERPHDAAVHLLREYVLPRHVELSRERNKQCCGH